MRPITMERVEAARAQILDTVCSKALTHEQKVTALERAAEALIEVLPLPSDYGRLKDAGIICDLAESNCPPRPRYILPDYEKLFREGCAFLQLPPPADLDEALNVLSIFIRHVPSVTNFPVFIGRLDLLLDPFVQECAAQESRAAAKKKIALFLRYVDRTVTDSFCHYDIGPAETAAGTIILECEKDAPCAVPNLSLLYDPDTTPENFALLAAECALSSAKPSFANHRLFESELGRGYALASCYNGLLIGGGAYTLSRLRLGHLGEAWAAHSGDIGAFYADLETAVQTMLAYMDARIDFIVNKSNFFESNFLAREGFIRRDKFTGMFGIVGLAECVNTILSHVGGSLPPSSEAAQKQNKSASSPLPPSAGGAGGRPPATPPERFGHSAAADELGVAIIEKIQALVNAHKNKYCEAAGGRFLLHGQVGIDTDTGESPATRIPIGEEPEDLAEHLTHCGLFHRYFPAGTGDVFPLEATVRQNPRYLLDIVRGAFAKGGRYFSFYAGDSDVFRVTGYLVKRSEMEKLASGNAVLQNTTALGLGAARNSHVLERKRR